MIKIIITQRARIYYYNKYFYMYQKLSEEENNQLSSLSSAQSAGARQVLSVQLHSSLACADVNEPQKRKGSLASFIT